MHYNSSININALALGNKLNEKVSLIYEIDLTDLNLSVRCKDGIEDNNRTYDLSKYADGGDIKAVLIRSIKGSMFGGNKTHEVWKEITDPNVTIISKTVCNQVNNSNRCWCNSSSIIGVRIQSK